MIHIRMKHFSHLGHMKSLRRQSHFPHWPNVSHSILSRRIRTQSAATTHNKYRFAYTYMCRPGWAFHRCLATYVCVYCVDRLGSLSC